MPRESGDVVLGLSLAEVIILLLFCFFVASALEDNAEADGAPPSLSVAALSSRVEELTAENKVLMKAVKEKSDELAALQAKYQSLLQMIGARNDSAGEIDNAISALRRGFRRCIAAGSNVLLDVRAIDGSLTASISVLDPGISRALGDSNRVYSVGQVLDGGEQIERFLSAVSEFQKEENCRYDYSLTYRDATDYHLARTEIERFLYPGRIRQE